MVIHNPLSGTTFFIVHIPVSVLSLQFFMTESRCYKDSKKVKRRRIIVFIVMHSSIFRTLDLAVVNFCLGGPKHFRRLVFSALFFLFFWCVSSIDNFCKMIPFLDVAFIIRNTFHCGIAQWLAWWCDCASLLALIWKPWTF